MQAARRTPNKEIYPVLRGFLHLRTDCNAAPPMRGDIVDRDVDLEGRHRSRPAASMRIFQRGVGGRRTVGRAWEEAGG